VGSSAGGGRFGDVAALGRRAMLLLHAPAVAYLVDGPGWMVRPSSAVLPLEIFSSGWDFSLDTAPALGVVDGA